MDSARNIPWLRIMKVSSLFQTASEAWYWGRGGKCYNACFFARFGHGCMVLSLLARLQRSFKLTLNSRTGLAGLRW